jgi:hypothetical protein
MDPREFAGSYMNVVLYLSERDPVMAEYLLARFPPFLEIDPNIVIRVKRNTNNWMKKVRFMNEGGDKQKDAVLPYDVFSDSVYHLARIYTHGTDRIPRNDYRANKFIRILKLLGDERHRKLQEQVHERKIKKMKKSS